MPPARSTQCRADAVYFSSTYPLGDWGRGHPPGRRAGHGDRPVATADQRRLQRLTAQAFPQIDILDVGCLLVNYVLSDPYVDVALVGMREPRFVEINSAISDDAASQLDLAQLHDRYVR